jgi:hypothetical protein
MSIEEENKILKRALFDLLDGNAAPHDIQYDTGLPELRCIEISDLYRKLVIELDKNPGAF